MEQVLSSSPALAMIWVAVRLLSPHLGSGLRTERASSPGTERGLLASHWPEKGETRRETEREGEGRERAEGKRGSAGAWAPPLAERRGSRFSRGGARASRAIPRRRSRRCARRARRVPVSLIAPVVSRGFAVSRETSALCRRRVHASCRPSTCRCRVTSMPHTVQELARLDRRLCRQVFAVLRARSPRIHGVIVSP